MKNLLTIFFLLSFTVLLAQEKIYNPDADAKTELEKAIIQAQTSNKHVLIQLGGNWCPWCLRLHQFMQNDKTIDSLLTANYIVLKINYSKENKNEDLLKRFEYPQRFGFPVLVVLDSKGTRIHTQDTGFLELDKSYDSKKICTFLKNWAPAAINPDTYKK
jgi:thioredoxin-related protein